MNSPCTFNFVRKFKVEKKLLKLNTVMQLLYCDMQGRH